MPKHQKHSPKTSAEVPLSCPSCGATPSRPTITIYPKAGARKLDVPYLRCSTCHIFEIDRRGAISAARTLYGDDPDPHAAKNFAKHVGAVLKGLSKNLSERGYRKDFFVPQTKAKPRP